MIFSDYSLNCFSSAFLSPRDLQILFAKHTMESMSSDRDPDRALSGTRKIEPFPIFDALNPWLANRMAHFSQKTEL